MFGRSEYDMPSLADCYEGPTEPCKCGECDWDSNYTCRCCGTGEYVESFTRTTVQVARKDHGRDIKVGDRYRRTVTAGYFEGGPRTLTVHKVKLDENGRAVWR